MTTGQPKALVIDDDDDFLLVMRKMLQREGIAADTAHSAADALAFFPQQHCDVIFCDVHMPGMSGIDFYKEVSLLAPGAEKRIIMLTGDVASEKTWEFIESRNVPYVLKPVNADELRKKLRLMVGDVARPATPAAPAPGAYPTTEKKGAEARRHRRVPLQSNVRVKSAKSGTSEVAKIINASKDGLLFLSTRGYEVGTDLKVCYPYTGGVNDIDSDAVVVRLEVRGNGQYGVAVALGQSAAVCRSFLKSAPPLVNEAADSTAPRVVPLAGFEEHKIRQSVSLEDFEGLKRQIEDERERSQRLDNELRVMRAARDRAVGERDQALNTVDELKAALEAVGKGPAVLPEPLVERPRAPRPFVGYTPPAGTMQEFEFGEEEPAPAAEDAGHSSMLDILHGRGVSPEKHAPAPPPLPPEPRSEPVDPVRELLHLRHEIEELHRQLADLRQRPANKHS